MGSTGLKDELDPRFTERQWKVQRIGWLIMLLVIVAAVLGFFGTSPLASKVETRDEGTAHYEVEHPRFSRYQLLDRLHVRVHAPDAAGEELQIAFSPEYVSNNNIRSSAPDPDGGGAGAAGAYYGYKVSDWSQPIVVAFEFEPRKAFWSAGVVTITAGELEPVRMQVDTWVHP